jgi:poly-gamma-glutamate synthesis protein (capsule biosynthesis protein)
MEIKFLGDVFIKSNIETRLNTEDVIFVNLEAPITNSKNAYPEKVNLKISPNIFDKSFGSVVDGVCLANNHIMDYGEEGFKDTIKYLKDRGIEYFGAGKKENNYENPTYIMYKGRKISILGYVCSSTSPVYECGSVGCAPIDKERIISDIEAARNNNSDEIIVQFHWGAEEVSVPKPSDVKIARMTVDSGADLVLGHHAHVIQKYEEYNGKSIYYGVGNFAMSDLNEKSYYENGKYTRTFVQKQYKWNKKSLCVTYNPCIDKYTHKVLYYDGAVIRSNGNSGEASNRSLFDLSFYGYIYKLYYIFSKVRRLLVRFFSNPKIPKLKHIINIYSIVFGKKDK